MATVYATFPKTSLKFYVPSNLAPAIKKMLSNLGWPQPWLTYSFDKKLKIKDCGNELFEHVNGEFGESIPIISPTENGSFTATYHEDDNSVTYGFSGEFLVFGCTDDSEAKIYKKIAEGYISILKVHDAKGKAIKLPKDEYGIATALEGTTQPDSYGALQKVTLSVDCRD